LLSTHNRHSIARKCSVTGLRLVVKKSYRERRRQADDVLLLIEVAGESLNYDRGEKASLYAEAGIQEYWVVNIADRQVEMYRWKGFHDLAEAAMELDPESTREFLRRKYEE
jgi:Uma2 family endonuclease